MNTIHLQLVQSCREHLDTLEKMSPLDKLQHRLFQLDEKINRPDLWANPSAHLIMRERSNIGSVVNFRVETEALISMFSELLENSDFILPPSDLKEIQELNVRLHTLVFQEMMKDPIDQTPAIVTISAGAGGLEAANWVSMLLRMYVRYAESHGFKSEIIDEKRS